MPPITEYIFEEENSLLWIIVHAVVAEDRWCVNGGQLFLWEKKDALLERMGSAWPAPLLQRWGCVQTSHNIWPVSSHTADWNILKCRRQTEQRKNSMRLDCATVPQDGEKMGWQEFAAPRSHLPFLAGGGSFKATKWKEKRTGDFRQSRRDLAI